MLDAFPQVRLHSSLTRRVELLEPTLAGRADGLRYELTALWVEVRDTPDGHSARVR